MQTSSMKDEFLDHITQLIAVLWCVDLCYLRQTTNTSYLSSKSVSNKTYSNFIFAQVEGMKTSSAHTK